MENERRNSERIKHEMPITFDIGNETFSGTTVNLSKDGMMIECSLAYNNLRRIIKALFKTEECSVLVNYSIDGKSFSRFGKIKHYHLDFSGSQSASGFCFGVWIPNLRIIEDIMVVSKAGYAGIGRDSPNPKWIGWLDFARKKPRRPRWTI